MAGGVANPNPNWLRQLVETFPEWAASKGIEPPAGRAVPINTIGQPGGTPPMGSPEAPKFVTRDAGSAYGQGSGGSVAKLYQDRVIGTESPAPGTGSLPPGIPGMPPQNFPVQHLGPEPRNRMALLPPLQGDGGMSASPAADSMTPGVPSQPAAPVDTIPPPMDPVTQMEGTPPTPEGPSLGSLLGLMQLAAPPELPTPAAPAPPPIRPVDSKLMEVLAMGLRPGANAGALGPFMGLLGKG